MLSETEYYTALQEVNNIPSDIHGTYRQNYKQQLKKQIKEYEYNLKYEKFEPLPHIPYFVNKLTTEQTLHQLIQAATSSSEFIIDTESMNIYKEKNKPVLMQIQILLPYNLSLVMIVEMHHLPRDNTIQFTFIKQLFNNIFISNKIHYIWGTKDELFPFIEFKLFSREQIKSITPINLQHQFKLFWNKKFPHNNRISTSTDTLGNNCKCEKCIGKKSSEPWSLQDSTAHLLNEYLPKILTREKFNIGLDTNLFNLDFKEKQYRQDLTTYALNDCLSMQRILIYMKNENFEFTVHSIKHKKSTLIQLSPINSDDDDDDLLFTQINSSVPKEQQNLLNQNNYSNEPFTPSIVTLEDTITCSTHEELPVSHPSVLIPSIVKLRTDSRDWESKKTNQNDTNTPDWTNTPLSPNHQDDEQEEINLYQELSTDERRKLYNRKCTIKQRQRYYKNELILRDINPRLSIRRIKLILKQNDIDSRLVNTSTSKKDGKRSLYVAIRDPSLLEYYYEKTKNLFTRKNYNENRRRTNTSRRNESSSNNKHYN